METDQLEQREGANRNCPQKAGRRRGRGGDAAGTAQIQIFYERWLFFLDLTSLAQNLEFEKNTHQKNPNTHHHPPPTFEKKLDVKETGGKNHIK